MIATAKKHAILLAAAALIAVGVSACGGGGGGGADTGGMPTINYGDGLFASPGTSPLAMSSADTLLSIGDNDTVVAPLSAAIGMEFDAQGNVSVMVLPEGQSAYIASATMPDDQGTFTMVYVVDGQRTEVEFQSIDRIFGTVYAKMIDGVYYYVWSAPTFTGSPPQDVTPEYFELYGWRVGDDYRGYATNGMLTPPDQLTSLGTATYEGQLVAEYWRTNDPSPGLFVSIRGRPPVAVARSLAG